MNATRTRSTSSKKSAQKRGRSGTSASSRGAKGGSGSRKSTSSTTRGRGASKSASSSRKSSASKSGTKSSTKSSSGSRGSRTPIGQAIELLTEDHRKVQKMFRQAERLKDDMERLRPLVEQACAALTQHTEIEEQYFYPVMQETGKETDMIAEAYVEHASAKELIAQLQQGRAEDEQYAAMFTVLGEYVNHHIKEEEGDIFPKAKRARADFQPLLDALTMREEGATAQASTGGRSSRSSEAQDTERGSARGRQGRGRSSREGAGSEGTASSGRQGSEGDVEQPRRGRRGGSQEESADQETSGRGRGEESQEQEGRSREANR